MPMLEKIGAKIVRDEMGWQWVEKDKGNFSLDLQMVGYINQLNARGIKPLLVLCYSNTLYAPNEKYGPDSPALREAFGRYVAFMVASLKGKVYAWEIWNEPDWKDFWKPAANLKNYSLLVKYVAPIIRQNDPNALIVAGAWAEPKSADIDRLVRADALRDVDVISFHWYTYPKDPESGEGVEGFSEYQGAGGGYKEAGKRPWITEMGYPTSTDKFGVSEQQQADYTQRQLELARDMGVEVCIIYDLVDDGSDPGNLGHRHGLFREDGTAKPAARIKAFSPAP